MEKQRDSKIMALVALVVAVIGTTVAFAAMSSTLTIGNTSNVTVDARWAIEFTNIQTATSGQAVIGAPAPAINDGDKTKISDYTGTIKAPEDSITVTFTVTNNGTIAASLTEITKNAADALTCTSIETTPITADETKVKNELSYELYAGTTGTTPVEANNSDFDLDPGESQVMRLVLTYDADNSVDTATELPQGKVSITGLGLSLKYDQK